MSVDTKYPLDVSNKMVKIDLTPSEYFETYLREISLQADAVANVASDNASDLATVITLANELKSQLNSLLVNLRDSGKLDA
jgi:hypothetical protein